jgi:arylsulfatase A-like enzyme
MARRLVERGVRFVQIYSGGGPAGGQNTWDGHHGIEENLAIHCPEIDKPIAGLLTDLEQRGLLEETLVVWGGEFGRQPVSETFNTGGKPGGRDHNPQGFTYWMAGAGVKAGTSYGATDEIGERAVENRHHLRDLHATILSLMGLDHRELTYFYGGLDNKLTGVVEAEVIRGVLAL